MPETLRSPLQLPWALLAIAMLLPPAALAQAQSVDPADAIGQLQQQLALRREAVSQDTTLSAAARQSEQAGLQQVDAELQAAMSDRDETALLVQQRLVTPAILGRLAAGETLAPANALPAGWGNGTQAQLEAVLAEADAAAQAASQRVSQLQAQAGDLSSRLPLLGADLAAARQSLVPLQALIAQASSAAGKDSDEPDSRGLLQKARAQALLARIALIEEQRDGADLRGQLLAAEIADAERQVEALDSELAAVRDVVARRRLSDAIERSAQWQASSVGRVPEIERLAQSNRDLAALYVGPSAITRRIDGAQAGLSGIERTAAVFQADSQALSSRLTALGRSVAAGVLIRESLRSLPSLAHYQSEIASRRTAIEEAQVRVVELTSQRQRLERDFAGVTNLLLAEISGLRPGQQQEARDVVGSLLQSRLQILAPLVRDLERYVGVLIACQDQQRAFVASVEQVRERLRGQEPWVRNARVVSRVDFEQALGGMRALVSPVFWAEGGRSAWAAVRKLPGGFVAAMLVIIGGVALMLALHRRRLFHVADSAASRASYSRCLVGALMNGLAVMAILAALGRALGSIDGAPAGLHVLGLSLTEASVGGFGVGLIAALFARRGGIVQFRPDLASVAARGREAVWLLSLILLLALASRMLFAAHAEDATAHADLAARLCLMLSALVMAAMIHRVLVLQLKQAVASGRRRARRAWTAVYAAAMLVPGVFLWLLVQGFLIGALELTRSLMGTLLVLASVATVRATVSPPGREDARASSTADAAARRGRDRLGLAVLLVAAAALLLWIWRNVFVAFGYLRNVVLWSTETAGGLTTVTVANLLACVATLAGTWLAFWVLPLVTGTRSLDTVARGVGTRYAVVTLLRYAVLMVGVLVAFTFLNIGWSKIQWLATGLSVGLGFGLQEIVANFFSGLILLSERSIRVGDMVAVGDQTGVVTRIHVRATTVRDYDGREILIPNKEMVAAQVTNWTLSNTERRLQVVVGVAYGSDTALVQRLLLEAAARTPGVLAAPAPSVAFELFGDSSLQFRLYCWIAAADRAVVTNHLLHVQIEETLRVNGISIPFPQRELHLNTTTPPQPCTVDPK